MRRWVEEEEKRGREEREEGRGEGVMRGNVRPAEAGLRTPGFSG